MKKILLLLFLFCSIVVSSQVAVMGGGVPEGAVRTYEDVISDSGYAWYIADAANYTTVGDTVISQWDDESGNDYHLLQADAAQRPHYDGDSVWFDGVDDIIGPVTFTWNQPSVIFLVVNPLTWVSTAQLFQGGSNNNMKVYQTGTSPGVRPSFGTTGGENSNLTLETWHILKLVGNGTSGILQIDETTATEGNFGANNPGGLTLGAYPTESSFSNVAYKEIICLGGIDADDQTIIYDYLTDKYGL